MGGFRGVIRQTAGNWKWKNEKGERFFSNSKGGFVSYVKLGRTWPRFDMFGPVNIDLELGFF
jgi:hypothetical protein